MVNVRVTVYAAPCNIELQGTVLKENLDEFYNEATEVLMLRNIRHQDKGMDLHRGQIIRIEKI